MKTEQTAIEWADYTFNPWRGCTKVSAGCAHCYAETLSKRNPGLLGEWGKGKPRVLASEAMWQSPLKWNGDAAKQVDDVLHCFGADKYEAPPRPRVFCASLADWLDDEVPPCWRLRLLKLIFDTPNLDWLLLSKRPANFMPMLAQCMDMAYGVPVTESPFAVWLEQWLCGTPPNNVWLGTSVENQSAADERIPALLKIPARVRFLSCEPLLGAVDLKLMARSYGFPRHITSTGSAVGMPQGIHWVICGGESGPNARPMHPDWARSLRDQCQAAGVPFLFKQWGEWAPGCPSSERPSLVTKPGEIICRFGKQHTGRQLDDELHTAFPTL